MSTKIITCIGCPLGCELSVQINNSDISVSGQACKIGDTYGKEEATNPRRNIATSIPVDGGDIPMLSVKNNTPIPKEKIFTCVSAIKKVRAKAPIKVGDTILTNAAGTGIDFVATRNIVKV